MVISVGFRMVIFASFCEVVDVFKIAVLDVDIVGSRVGSDVGDDVGIL